MAHLSKWYVSIEYGPVAADVHDFTVDARNAKDALTKAQKWAKNNNIHNPMFGEPYQDDYDDLLEWDSEDEDEFMSIIEKSTNTDDH